MEAKFPIFQIVYKLDDVLKEALVAGRDHIDALTLLKEKVASDKDITYIAYPQLTFKTQKKGSCLFKKLKKVILKN